MKGLGGAQVDYHVCLLCGTKSKNVSFMKHHIQDPTLKAFTPTYHIGDRVAFQIGSESEEHGGGKYLSYTDHEGTIINLLMHEEWLSQQYLLNTLHDTRYLYGYQIRADNGHMYQLNLVDRVVKLVEAAPQTTTYEGHKQVFTSDELREEIKKDPRWQTFITPRFS